MDDRIEKSILATIAYFDVFEYPLTLIELQRFLLGRRTAGCGLLDASRALEEGALLQKAIRRKDGFLHARGQERLINTRHQRFLIAEQKYKQSQWLIRVLSYMPFVRGLFLCNSLALWNTTTPSDVDIVVITKSGGAWWARLLCVTLVSLLRRRPGQHGRASKICLSMFVDEDHLNLRQLRMSENDIDFAYWVANFYPIYDAGSVYSRFWAANNSWLSEVLPNARPVVAHPSRRIRHRAVLRPLFEAVLAPFTALIRSVQQKKFPLKIRELANRDTRVRVEEGILKFHVNDRRVAHLESFVRRYEALLVL